MGFDPTSTIQIGIGLTAFVSTIGAVFMFMTAPNERLARLVGFALLFYGLWGWFGFAFHLTDDLALAREFRLVSIIAQTVGQLIVMRFIYVYVSQKYTFNFLDKAIMWSVYAWNISTIGIFISDMFGTALLAGPVGAEGLARLTPEPGVLFWFIFGIWIYMPIAIAYLSWHRMKQERGRDLIVSSLFIGSIIGSFVFGTPGYLAWIGITGPYSVLRGLAIPLFLVAAFYSIANYRLFNIRTATAQFFVYILWAFVIYRMLVNESFMDALPDVLLLVGVIVFGIYFIRSIANEFAIRLRLEDVSKRLRVLNSSLESEVEKRTAELRRAKAHTDQVIEHLPIGLIEIKSDATIVRSNAASAALLQQTETAMNGKSANESPQLATILGDGVVPGVREVHLDQSQKDVEATIAPLTLEEGSGHVVILRDITERRALDRAKNEFVSTAAHQLRTPLAAIKWTFELLSSGSLSKEQHEILEQGAAAATNMQRIAEGLMMSIRSAEGLSKYTFRETAFAPVVRQALTLVTPLAKKKNIPITVDIPETMPAVSIDTERMLSAIQNLLDNAVKYTRDGGTVMLRVSHDDRRLTVSVTDTGIGISPEDQTHLFEKFFRAHEATEVATDGSGLGLSIVKSIITAHGGTLSVESEEGVGSTFSFTIPLAHRT